MLMPACPEFTECDLDNTNSTVLFVLHNDIVVLTLDYYSRESGFESS